MSNKVWVFIDQFKGSAYPVSWEAVGAGRKLAEKLGGGVTAVVLGAGSQPVAAEAFQYGVDQVFYSDDATLADFRPEPYASLLSKLVKEAGPEVLLLPTTTRGRELSAMCAVDLKSGVMPDVTAMEVENGRVVTTRPVYAGKLISKVVCDVKPQIITTRAPSQQPCLIYPALALPLK